MEIIVSYLKDSIIFLIMLSFFSCSNTEDDIALNNFVSIKKDKTIFIEIDSLTSHEYKYYGQLEYNNDSYFIGLHSDVITYINLSKQKIEKHFFIDKEGINGIPVIQGIIPIDINTNILKSNTNTFFWVEIDSIIHKYDLSNKLEEEDDFYNTLKSINKGINFTCNYNNKTLIFPICIDIEMGSPEYFEFPFLASYNTSNNKFNVFGKYTKHITDGYFDFNAYPHICYANNKTYVNFGADNIIQEYDSVGVLLNKYKIRSKGFIRTKTNSFTEDDMYEQAFSNYLITSPSFFGLYYDKFNNYFYIIAKQEQDLYNKEGKLNTFLEAPFSIIITDNKFNILGESFFNGKTYDFSSPLITKEGIYLYNKIKTTENVIQYDVYKIHKKI